MLHFSNLRTKGITREQLDRVHSPIGLPIGAETPEEIAVSIMAEIVTGTLPTE
jgi:xanthine dehydrogenase accessory factor